MRVYHRFIFYDKSFFQKISPLYYFVLPIFYLKNNNIYLTKKYVYLNITMMRTRKRNYENDSANDVELPPVKKKAERKRFNRNYRYNKMKLLRIQFLPSETWLQILGWIHRLALGFCVSLVCNSFSEVANIRLHKRCSLFPNNNMRSLPELMNIVCTKKETDSGMFFF